MKVEIADQVRNFVRTLPPVPRGKLRTALHRLEQERGDIKAMEGPLDGYFRLQVSSYRIIFRYHLAGNTRILRCDFAEKRSVIYEAFRRLVD